MNIHEAVATARDYLFLSHTVLSPEVKGEPKDWMLDRQLQYLLCHAFSRLEKRWGCHNISDCDIHMLVESWVMAQGTSPFHLVPLVRIGMPERT